MSATEWLRDAFHGPDAFVSSSARYIRDVDLYPVYMIVHYVLVASALRSTAGSHSYAREYPISSWAISVISCFGGSIITQFLLGLSIVEPLQNEKLLITATLVWYLVFFSPFDIVWRVMELKLTRAVLVSLKEIHRVRMIMMGVAAGMKYYPGSMTIVILLGCIKGSGAKFLLRPVNQVLRGEVICLRELQRPQFSTKASVILSTLLALMKIKNVAICQEDTLLVTYVAVTVAVNLSFLFLNMEDPFARISKVIGYIIFKLPQELVNEVEKKKTE